MTTVLDRVEARDGRPALKAGGRPVAEVLQALESGESPDRLAGRFSLVPADLLAAIAYPGLEPEGPPLVREQPPRPWLRPAVSDEALARLLPEAPRPTRLALAAGLSQIHDFWDESHHAAQQADDLGESAVSAYWHGIAHRREPDAANAAYWFRRVGPHEVFPALAGAAGGVLEATPGGEALMSRLVKGGRWDPFAFIEACRAAREPAALRAIQAIEMRLLLDATVRGLA